MRQLTALVLFACIGCASAPAQFQNPAPLTKSLTAEQIAQRHAAFESGRKLLLAKGVPFDPDELLELEWRRQLRGTLDAMPEMSEVRYDTAPLDGVYIADTLYLPENVKLVGNTVILTRHLVFEGNNPIVAGPHALHIFQLFPPAALGASLPDTLRWVGWPVSLQDGSPPGFAIVQPRLKFERHHITVDVSGVSASRANEHH